MEYESMHLYHRDRARKAPGDCVVRKGTRDGMAVEWSAKASVLSESCFHVTSLSNSAHICANSTLNLSGIDDDDLFISTPNEQIISVKM